MASTQDPKYVATGSTRVVNTSTGPKETGVITHKETSNVVNKRSFSNKDNNAGETPIWKKAVIGGVAVLLTVAAVARLRKADEDGDLEDAKSDAQKKGNHVKGAAKGAARKVEGKVKEAGSWTQDKFGDVMDVTGSAAEATGDKLNYAKDVVKDKATETKHFLEHKKVETQKEAEKKAAEADKEQRRLADKAYVEDRGFLGWKKWFK